MGQCIVERVDAGNQRERTCLQSLDEARYVARIGDQELAAADLHHQQRAGREPEDVIERQRRHHDVVGAITEIRHHPGFALHHVRRHVAMEQHRAFGDAGRAAGILQEREIVRRRPSPHLALRCAPSAITCPERYRPRAD